MGSGVNIRNVEIVTSDLDMMCSVIEEYQEAIEIPRLFIPEISVTLIDHMKPNRIDICVAIVDQDSEQVTDNIGAILIKYTPKHIAIIYSSRATKKIKQSAFDRESVYGLTE